MHDSNSCERYRIMAGKEKEGNLIKREYFWKLKENDGSKLCLKWKGLMDHQSSFDPYFKPHKSPSCPPSSISNLTITCT